MDSHPQLRMDGPTGPDRTRLIMNTTDQRGFALPAAIGALVIIGVLMTAGFFMAQQELRIGVASNHANMAVNIAQAGANEVLSNWNGYQLGNIGIWSDTTLTSTTENGVWTVTISNANNFIYFLTATGEVTEGGAMWAGARRTIGIATKILFADINPPAAFTTRGSVEVKGTALINGTNTTPTTWGPYCGDVATNDTTGILVNDITTPPTTSGSGDIQGNPPYDEDPTMVDQTFTQFGDMDWAQLTTLAALEGKDLSSITGTISTIEPVVVGGLCDTSPLLNWGDTLPTAPCGSYFPLLYHGGSMRIQGNAYGQGILLVEGDLELRGGFVFYGIIIIQGSFSTQGSGNRIIGAVMASNGGALDQTSTGGSEVTYSRCTITRAVLNNASLSRARPVGQRGWVDLSAVAN